MRQSLGPAAVPALLDAGLPRSMPAIIAALPDRHVKDEVVGALMRLTVIGRVAQVGGKYPLALAHGVGRE
jgi:hypothetical protein